MRYFFISENRIVHTMKCDSCSGKGCCSSEDNSFEDSEISGNPFVLLFLIFQPLFGSIRY